MLDSRELYKTLTPEERHEKQLEYSREYYKANKEKVLKAAKAYRKRRKERERLQREQQQPTQVFPPPPAKA
jgi:hypothetical protein